MSRIPPIAHFFVKKLAFTNFFRLTNKTLSCKISVLAKTNTQEDTIMLERALIDHGSPTLANMKVGSLFTSSCADATGFRAEFRRVQAALESRGVSLTILRVQQERALVYVYRQEALAALLAQADVQAFLRQRLAESPCFPHEIGVFLGYPLSDVIAFMRDGGRGCRCSGCWKAYTNECEAMRVFQRYKACRAAYQTLFRAGWPLERLTVRA